MSTVKTDPIGFQDTAALAPSAKKAPTACVIMGLGRAGQPLADALEDYGIATRAGVATGEGLQAISEADPDVVLVGRETGNLELDRVVGLVRHSTPKAKILVLIDAIDLDTAREAVEAGADDVVTPPHAANHVVLRISMVLERNSQPRQVQPQIDTSSYQRPAHPSDGFSLEVADQERALILHGQKVQLAPRELQLLQILDEARGSVVSRETLLARIWGKDLEDDAVLDATVHRLRRKIEEVLPASNILVTVRGIGYRLESPRA